MNPPTPPAGASPDWAKKADELADEICTHVPDLADEMILQFAKEYAASLERENAALVSQNEHMELMLRAVHASTDLKEARGRALKGLALLAPTGKGKDLL